MKMSVRLSARQLAARTRRQAAAVAAVRQHDAHRARLRAPLCAAPGCGDRVRQNGHLMCRDHWLSLPEALRLVILRAQAAGHRATYADAFREAVDLLDRRA